MSMKLIQVSVDEQKLFLFEGEELVGSFCVSTGEKGVGMEVGSYRTPMGRFRVAKKIGDGVELGGIFRAREMVGVWDGVVGEEDLILTRILWLDGLEEENANTFERYIYVHGTNREDLLGRPASHGCVRLSNEDMLWVYDWAEEGTVVEILPPLETRGKLAFFDCDSTLSTIEGIDELARVKGDEVFAQVVELTHAAMNGEVPLDEVFPRRMEIIQPDRVSCEQVAELYRQTVTEGAREAVKSLQDCGWTVVIVSGGFAPLIEPLARDLGIRYVEAVPLFLDENGNYAGYGKDYPTTRNGGKNEIVREWKAAWRAEASILTGDGISDLETKGDVDLMIGYGGVVSRERVKAEADVWLTTLDGLVEVVEKALAEKK